MRRLVDDMLSLAREDSAAQAERAEVSTEDLAREASGSGPWEVEVQVDNPGRVRCDERLVVSVLESLVLNAVRHGAEPVTIEVDGSEIRVCDRGPGSPEEILADGPRRFRSIGPTGGSGLGLVIAQRRLERTGGTLGFGDRGEGRGGEGEPQGAVVSVRLDPAG
ncbi:HAMP domain-containing sensor histidine kinase [Brachybacterium sp. GPGPB12]|uniref:sensor histidine kinase n=1 Tax=Brachybacterium sp. GPGPB12 TaxID=3023517 RepID=UPI00313448C1